MRDGQMMARKLTKVVALCALVLGTHASQSVGAPPPFTYQGQLKYDGVPYNGPANFVFDLYDRDVDGRLIDTVELSEVRVVDGLFNVELGFTRFEFDGTPVWLEIYVRTELGDGVMDPRQPIRPAPYALYAFDAPADPSNDSPWTVSGTNVYYNTGNVGVGTSTPSSPLTVAGLIESASNGFKFPDGTVQTTAASGSGGDCLWSSGRDLIYYNGGRVGIGTSEPQADLDVIGGLAVDGFKLRTPRVPAGHILTTDANGVGTWQAPPAAADPVWGQSGSDIYYEGQVGIGTTNPQHTLEVVGYDAALVKAHNTSTYGEFAALHGETDSPDGYGVKGLAMGTTSDGAGIFGQSFSPLGMGVYGRNLVGGYGVYGEGDTADGGWAGYFSGRGYFSGDVGIGRTSPQAKLDVNGTVKMNGLQLGTSATAGYVLTANSSGVGTWQAPSGGGDFTLPVDETVDADGMSALTITNTGTGTSTNAIRAVINSSGSDESSAGSFRAFGSGNAINATSDGGTTVYASGDGIAVYGTTSGSGGGSFRSTMAGGYGVKGRATNTAGNVNTVGGWFESSGSTGKAIYAKATGAQAIGLRVETTGAESYAIDADSPYYGLAASGAVIAADFHGKVRVKSKTTNQYVLQVGNDGITQVDVLQIVGGSDLSEQFDVDNNASKVEPGMVVCIDPRNSGKLVISDKPYDRRVAGIISGGGGIDTGMLMGQRGSVADGAYPVALTGRVYVWADATNSPIEPGDLLTTSGIPGHAMKVADYGQAQGATLGKAMTSLDSGRGLVLVLVSLQ